MMKHRLIAVHLHDNNGKSDQHKPLFSGKMDWLKLASILRSSSYKPLVNRELSVHHVKKTKEIVFLKDSLKQGLLFYDMVWGKSR